VGVEFLAGIGVAHADADADAAEDVQRGAQTLVPADAFEGGAITAADQDRHRSSQVDLTSAEHGVAGPATGAKNCGPTDGLRSSTSLPPAPTKLKSANKQGQRSRRMVVSTVIA